jgi:iron complex outermembrane receptor protein
MSYKSRLIMMALASTALVPLAARAAAAAADSTGSGGTPQVAEAQTSISEIVVTAQKHEERLVNVPISVVAVSGEGLEKAGVTSMGALAEVVPALHIDAAGSAFQPSIRGIGTAIVGAGGASNIATYVDGIYKPDPYATNFNFIDVDSVQVLKGPQGTLFGRNATGGAILVTTKSPSFQPHADLKVGYGSFNTQEASAFVTGPLLADKIAASLAIGADRSDGYMRNILTNGPAAPSYSFTLRAKVLFHLTDWWKATLTFNNFRLSDPTLGTGSVYRGWTDNALLNPAPPIVTGNTYDVNMGFKVLNVSSGYGFNLKNEWDLGFATLTSYSSAQRDKSNESLNGLAGPSPANGTPFIAGVPRGFAVSTQANLFQTDVTYTQELDLSRQGKGPLDWVVGAFYYNDRFDVDPFLLALYGPFGPGGLNVNSGLFKIYHQGATAESGAFFGDATYNLGKLHLTAGARYSIDRAGEYSTTYFPKLIPYGARSTDFYAFTPRVVARYSITADSNVYVSYSKGTKAGLYNVISFQTQPNAVAPEKIVDIEAGYKISRLTWRLETSIFHYDYRNLQVATYNQQGGFVQNAKLAEVWGGDASYRQKLTDDLTLSIGAAYTHGRYRDFPNAIYQSFSGPGFGPPPFTGLLNSPRNVDGNEMERTPEFSGDVGLDYNHPLFGGSLNLNVSYSYRTRVFFDFANTQEQKAYGLLNLRAAWTDPSTRWTFALTGKNVTNQMYLVEVLGSAAAFQQTFGAPASVMFDVSYQF